MKKVLVVMLVLGMASLVNAAVIAVEPNGLGSMGNAGTSTDPLAVGEVLNLKIMLQNVPGSSPSPSYPSYEGYVLSMMDLSLTVTGPAVLAEKGTALKNQMKRNGQFNPWAQPAPLIVGNAIAFLAGTGPTAGIQAYPNDALLVWNLIITCEGTGPVTIDLAIHGLSQYKNNTKQVGWTNMGNDDLGDLIVHQVVPEPMTIAILGLGGLLLRRRR